MPLFMTDPNKLKLLGEDIVEEPRWPALVAFIGIGGLYYALPQSLSIGPRWLPLATITALLIPTVFTFKMKNHKVNQFLGHMIAATVTLFMIGSIALLVHALPSHVESAPKLLRSAITLWITNVLVFGLWYWRLDGGGPHQRDLKPGHTQGAFLFPQMALSEEVRDSLGESNWSPQFVDYLFLAFNTSSALSPADTAALSRWAKVLMMIQASTSLSIIALLAARAVNIL